MIEPSAAPEKLRVSILERIVPMLAFALAALGGGASAFLLFRLFWALQRAENAGVATVATGLAESNLAVLVGLYLALAAGFFAIATAFIRMFTAKKTASPPGSLYLIPGLLALLPAGLVWYVESLTIIVLLGISSPGGHGMADVLGIINTLLIAAMIAGPIIILILVALAIVPFSARSGRKFGPLLVLLLIGVLYVAAALAFQYRNLYLYKMSNERGALPSVILRT